MERLWDVFRKDPVALIGLVWIGGVSLAALLAPWLAPYPYEAQDPAHLLAPPSREHLLGTDQLGRDLLSRILYGARISMAVGILTSLAAVLVGTLYGAISGYKGGRWDAWMMRVVDVAYSLPDILLIILITVVIGRGFLGIFLALTLVSWVTVARIIRGEVLRIREMPFIEAARALGTSEVRILFRHILPNTVGPLIVTLTFRIPAAILAESTLSFIGLGLAPPYSSWGVLAHDGWTALRFYPHLILFPGLVLFLTVLAFNFVGNAIQEAFRPCRDH